MEAKLMNKEEARGLFNKFSILIGDRDSVRAEDVIELFGVDAMKFVKSLRQVNSYGIGDGEDQQYVELRGFYTAVTYNNIAISRREEKKNIETKQQALEKK